MAQRTRTQLGTLLTNLFSPGAPKVSKSGLQGLMAELVDSSSNVLDDAIPWRKAVNGLANTPPALFGEGDRWLVGAAPTGAWAGSAGKLATGHGDGSWTYTDVPDRAVLPSSTEANAYYVREGAATTLRRLSQMRTLATTADASVFGDALDTITATRMPLEKQTSYLLRGTLLLQSSHASAGVHVTLGADAALDTVTWRLDTLNADGTPAVQFGNALGAGTPTAGVPAANTTYVVQLNAMVKTMGTATELYLRLASSDGSRMARLMTGSTLQLTPLA